MTHTTRRLAVIALACTASLVGGPAACNVPTERLKPNRAMMKKVRRVGYVDPMDLNLKPMAILYLDQQQLDCRKWR